MYLEKCLLELRELNFLRHPAGLSAFYTTQKCDVVDSSLGRNSIEMVGGLIQKTPTSKYNTVLLR